MLLKSLLPFISLGQAAKILRQPTSRLSSDEGTIEPTPVNGTLTSFTVIEGNGCPAGSYQLGPFEPGKSINAFVDYDPSVFFYNSTTSPGPVGCTVSIDFEFVYPESGVAGLELLTVTPYANKYEEGDEERGTNFIIDYLLAIVAGDESLDGGMQWISVSDEPYAAGVGAAVPAEGTPGQIGIGTFRSDINIFTDFGPGEMALSRTTIGFGLRDLNLPE